MRINIKQHALWAGLALCLPGLAQADTLVTFQVDMTQQITSAAFTPGVNVVNARGTFNGYGTLLLTNDPSAANTNLYTGSANNTTDAGGALMSYKFCIDSGGWETGNNRQVGLPATNGAKLVVPSCYFNDQARTDVTVNNNITFQVDMTQQIAVGNFIPGTSVASARGGFNGWGTTALTNDPSAANTNIYKMTVAQVDAPINLEHFKFYIDTGGNWEGPSIPSEQGREGDLNRYYNMLASDGDVVLPVVYFNDIPPAPPATNTVTFQVDMSIQASIGHFNFNAGDTVECRGSFNNWNAGAFVLTNDPTAANSNLFSGTVDIIAPPNSIAYKFWDSDALAGNNNYESPSSTGGNNRSLALRTTNSTYTVPAVLFSDLHSGSDFVPADTLVTLTVCMTNANGTTVIDTTGHTFDSSSDTVWVNGDFVPWWGWSSPLGPPAQYQATNNPIGSPFYQCVLTIPRGNSLQLTYKYSLNGADNELPSNVNHIRLIRAAGSYSLPTDTFGVRVTEPSFGLLSAAQGTAGHTVVSWLGRPGVHLQAKAGTLSGSWQDLFNTDGTNWSNGFLSTNGFVSVTNWPSASGNEFFRLINP